MAFAGSVASRVDDAERRMYRVPARFMAPRILLVASTAVLAVFGLVMIYSASSIKALYSYNDPQYFLERQAFFIAAGVVVAVVLARFDYRRWSGRRLVVLWLALLGLLLAVRLFGTNVNGARRWLSLGPFTLQPSEFAKPVIVLLAADLLDRQFEQREFASWWPFVWRIGLFLGVPMFFILMQPDKGTTGILGLTVLLMFYLMGVKGLYMAGALGLMGAGGLALALKDSYSLDRIQAMLDPFNDVTNNSYQLMQGFYAFGSGGLFGRGIGMSRQKYYYLPEAHTDFIFAVIGEELGLVGTLSVLALFLLLIWAGFRIAEEAPDRRGRILAGGATAIFGIQLLLNVCGVLGLFPLSGKPVPFLSYGGSSIVANFMLVGLILSVSRQSRLPETVYDRRRSQLRLAGEEPSQGLDAGGRGSYRRGRNEGPSRRSGGRDSALGVRSGRGSVRTWGASSRGGWERTDLSGDPADRLWKHDSTQTRGRSRSRGGRSERDR